MPLTRSAGAADCASRRGAIATAGSDRSSWRRLIKVMRALCQQSRPHAREADRRLRHLRAPRFEPRRVRYTAPEVANNTSEPSIIGMSKWELDTPALCVDLEVFEQNLAAM